MLLKIAFPGTFYGKKAFDLLGQDSNLDSSGKIGKRSR